MFTSDTYNMRLEDIMLSEMSHTQKCMESYYLTGIVWDNLKVQEIDSGDGCTTVWMYLISLKYTHKNE